MTDKTKTVAGYFGDKQVTRDEFVKQWTDHFGQLFHLAGTVAEFEELKAIKARVADMAGKKWDELKD